ncbi:MAG: hypothetical protein IT343_09775 [Candidatus Melainabacteria bacterium]|jgi:hypothetical protein|nr:hypothetical protein [Candidatus Melainabacteria bacterium]
MKTIKPTIVVFCVLTIFQPRFSYAADVPSGRNLNQQVTGQSAVSPASQADAPAAGQAPNASQALSALDAAKKRLIDAADARGLDITRIKGFLTKLDATSARYGTTEKQLVDAMDGLTEILTSTTKSPLYSGTQLEMAFETALHNIACPMEIDQGYHPTCNVTTVEVFAAARHPDKYVALVKEVALTGGFTADDGRVARPPKNALLPGDDENNYDITQPNSDKRNLASQIVQMTLINGAYELGHVLKQKSVRKPDGTTEYVMAPVTDRRYVLGKRRKKPYGNGFIDLGEDMLVDLNGKGIINSHTKELEDGPAFTQDEVVAASKMWLGYEMPYIATPYMTTTYDPRTGKTTQSPWVYDLPDKARLLKAKADGKFPLGVPTIGGAHVQTIHDVAVDKRGTVWVLLDNQHGTERDGWVPLSDLHSTQKNNNVHLKPNYRPDDLSWNK